MSPKVINNLTILFKNKKPSIFDNQINKNSNLSKIFKEIRGNLPKEVDDYLTYITNLAEFELINLILVGLYLGIEVLARLSK